MSTQAMTPQAMTTQFSSRSAMDAAVGHLIANYSPQGNRVGWLMMSSILVEAWDLYSIAFVLIFIRDQSILTRCSLGSLPRERRAER